MPVDSCSTQVFKSESVVGVYPKAPEEKWCGTVQGVWHLTELIFLCQFPTFPVSKNVETAIFTDCRSWLNIKYTLRLRRKSQNTHYTRTSVIKRNGQPVLCDTALPEGVRSYLFHLFGRFVMRRYIKEVLNSSYPRKILSQALAAVTR